MQSLSCSTSAMEFDGQPNFAMIFKRLSRLNSKLCRMFLWGQEKCHLFRKSVAGSVCRLLFFFFFFFFFFLVFGCVFLSFPFHLFAFLIISINFDPSKYAILVLSYQYYEVWWTAKLCQDFPKSFTTNCVECFGEVDKGHIEVHILILAIFWRCLVVKIMCIVPLFFRIYIDFLEISHTFGLSFCLYRCIMHSAFQTCGIAFFLHMQWSKYVKMLSLANLLLCRYLQGPRLITAAWLLYWLHWQVGIRPFVY